MAGTHYLGGSPGAGPIDKSQHGTEAEGDEDYEQNSGAYPQPARCRVLHAYTS